MTETQPMPDITLQNVHAHVLKLAEWQDNIEEWKDDLEGWKDDTDQIINGIEKSIEEMRERISHTATKEDVREIRKAIMDGNANFSAALQSVPARFTVATVLIGLIGSIAMTVAAIAAFYR